MDIETKNTLMKIRSNQKARMLSFYEQIMGDGASHDRAREMTAILGGHYERAIKAGNADALNLIDGKSP